MRGSSVDITLGDILEARERLRPILFPTELVPSTVLSGDGREVCLKTESLQVTGSFKVRGAYIKLASLTCDERAQGVIASSAGNHAQGVALAARMFQTPATIVMPEGAPLAKIAGTRELGANVILSGMTYDDAYHKAREVQAQTGATFVHPFDDAKVIAGQGTIGLEILQDLPDVRAIVAPIGGGGMIAGIALAVKRLKPEIKIIGVEAEGCASMKAAIAAGRPVELESINTIADGIAVRKVGELPYKICAELLDDIVTVDDDEIAQTILLLLERSKIITEGAGACAAAALLYNKIAVSGKIAAVLSGGNIDVTMLSRIIDKGMMKAGRLVTLQTIIEDKPGRLHRLLKVVSQTEANVVSIAHDRTNLEAGLNKAMLQLTLETQDHAHIERIVGIMRDAGYSTI
ncbi:MAG: threonine ammonia-lyase [Oscillospiraceae bacterium]|jgi:threonine dehydratase|nr:threonine ammonia-lyase [Oscillospiraceae bacterium]